MTKFGMIGIQLILTLKMKKKIIFLVLLILLLSFSVSGLSLKSIFNPYTQRLDYIRTANFSGENFTAFNITAEGYFEGDGSLLTGISGSGDGFTNWINLMLWNQTKLNETYAQNESVVDIWAYFGNYVSSTSLNATYALNDTLTDYVNWVKGNLTYVNKSGDRMTGNLDVSGNITVDEYIFGQPLEGGVSNGIIWAAEIDGFGQLNLSHEEGTREITYPDMTVRIVSTPDGNEKYCDIPGAMVEVTDNAHVAYVVDASDCSLSFVPVSTFVDAGINQAGNIPLFHAMSHNGVTEVHQGMPILNRLYIRSRLLNLKTINLDVISGMGLTKEGLLNFTINLGEYIFIDAPVSSTVQNLSNNATLEIFFRDGGTYEYDEYFGGTQTGLNLTSCEDASQNLVECSAITKYRRYFIFITGYDNSDDDTKLHQRLASDEIYYTTLAGCLNTETNPITYDLPDIYDYTAVPVFAYCGQANDNALSEGAFIDLRTVQTGQASGGIDTSIFLTKDGSTPLTSDWAAGDYTINQLEANATRWNNATEGVMRDDGWNETYTLNDTLYDYVDWIRGNATYFLLSSIGDYVKSENLNLTYALNDTLGDYLPDTTTLQSASNVGYTNISETFTKNLTASDSVIGTKLYVGSLPIDSNATCIFIRGGTSTWEIC